MSVSLRAVDAEQVARRLTSELADRQRAVSNKADHAFLERVQARVLAQSYRLPGFPETPAALDALLAQAEPEPAALVDVVVRDPWLVRQIWTLANSGSYGEPVIDLGLAIARVGPEQIWTLGVRAALKAVPYYVPGYEHEVAHVRQEALEVAELAAWMTQESRGPHYLAGLFAGVGKLLLLLDATPEDRLARPRRELVQEVVRQFHHPLAFLALDSWGIETGVCVGVGNSPFPADVPEEHRSMAAVHHVALKATRAASGVGPGLPPLAAALHMAPEVRPRPASVLRRARVIQDRREEAA